MSANILPFWPKCDLWGKVLILDEQTLLAFVTPGYPKVLNMKGGMALCRPHKFLHTKLIKSCLYGAGAEGHNHAETENGLLQTGATKLEKRLCILYY